MIQCTELEGEEPIGTLQDVRAGHAQTRRDKNRSVDSDDRNAVFPLYGEITTENDSGRAVSKTK